MNPEILPVLDEISAVLKKHDMMGLVIVANPTHVDFRMEVEASWSCAKMEYTTVADGRRAVKGVRIRSKLAEYPSKEAQKETMTTTVGTFVSMTDAMAAMEENILMLLAMLDEAGVKFSGKSTRED